MENLPKYLNWKEEKISDFSEKNVTAMYDKGFVFTRIGKGVLQQTRSVRINLSIFELTSENRRILKKVEHVGLNAIDLPISKQEKTASGIARYIEIGMAAKYFYDQKFGKGTFSAQKIYEIITGAESNFNILLNYSELGYCMCYENKHMIHYSYPFYHIDKSEKDMGLGMMIKAIVYAKEKGLQHIYLGSLQRPGDTYKLQFEGLEWFDGKKWSKDVEEVKNILKDKAVQ